MGMKYLIKVEHEWKPDPKQTEIKGTERKPKRIIRKIAAAEENGGLRNL